jgi:hypothetical protein
VAARLAVRVPCGSRRRRPRFRVSRPREGTRWIGFDPANVEATALENHRFHTADIGVRQDPSCRPPSRRGAPRAQHQCAQQCRSRPVPFLPLRRSNLRHRAGRRSFGRRHSRRAVSPNANSPRETVARDRDKRRGQNSRREFGRRSPGHTPYPLRASRRSVRRGASPARYGNRRRATPGRARPSKGMAALFTTYRVGVCEQRLILKRNQSDKTEGCHLNVLAGPPRRSPLCSGRVNPMARRRRPMEPATPAD